MEEYLFQSGRYVYYLGVANNLLGINSDMNKYGDRDEQLRRLGEVSHMFTDAGLILITSISDLEDYELDMIERLNQPYQCVVVSVGTSRLNRRREDLSLQQDITLQSGETWTADKCIFSSCTAADAMTESKCS